MYFYSSCPAWSVRWLSLVNHFRIMGGCPQATWENTLGRHGRSPIDDTFAVSNVGRLSSSNAMGGHPWPTHSPFQMLGGCIWATCSPLCIMGGLLWVTHSPFRMLGGRIPIVYCRRSPLGDAFPIVYCCPSHLHLS